MASFNYKQIEDFKVKAANFGNQPKIGFFKLGVGEEALVRFNVSSVNDLHFESVHKPVFGRKFEGLSNPYAGISCLSQSGYHDEASCPLCRAAAQEGSAVSKVTKLVYVPMLVSYKDKTTGQFSEAVPVIWERSTGFANELATKIASYGDLSKVVLKMTRVGSGAKDTRYTLDYIPVLDNPANCPVEKLSAFTNFDVSKHSYWVKSVEELEAYLATGSFPEAKKEAAQEFNNTKTFAAETPAFNAQPTYVAPTDPTTSVDDNTTPRPARTFTPGRF